MISKKEFFPILVSIIILSFSFTLFEGFFELQYFLPAIFSVIFINIISKKIASFYLESTIEMKFWEIKRFGYKTHQHFKNALASGIIFPVLSSILTLGNLIWSAVLVFDVSKKSSRSSRRFGLYSFSEVTEGHIGLIATSGIVLNLIFAIFGYLINKPLFAELNLYYALFNLIPFSDLDGNKIYFGSVLLWTILASITLIGVFLSILVV